MDLASARSFFPGTSDKVFLDAACVSLMPTQADEALRRVSSALLACPRAMLRPTILRWTAPRSSRAARLPD